MPVQAKCGELGPTGIRLHLQILRILALQILFLQTCALTNSRSRVGCTSHMLDKFTLPRGFSLSILCRTSQARLCDVYLMLRDHLRHLRCFGFVSRRSDGTVMRLNLIARFAVHARFRRIMYGCRNRERRAETTHYGVKILKF